MKIGLSVTYTQLRELCDYLDKACKWSTSKNIRELMTQRCDFNVEFTNDGMISLVARRKHDAMEEVVLSLFVGDADLLQFYKIAAILRG